MSALQPVRGTRDILPEEMRRQRAVIETAREIAERYGYLEMATPIFEFTEVFKRTLGDTSDIVTKEMYTFSMKEGEQITLRPENTAGVARALMSGGLSQQLPLKFFYAGPMFRHERPQKGRQRQFHQFGAELLGVPKAQGDIELIALGAHILTGLGVYENTSLELNTLGDSDSRTAYRAALVEYFSDHRDDLSGDSRDRLERNPLRILDSKNEGDRKIVAGAPVFGDYLNAESGEFFATVKEGLEALGIAYNLNPRLVRGLDYYCHTAFEFTTDMLGAQSAVLAGGRYDGLVETMGGPATTGVGWAAGIERLSMLMDKEIPAPRPIAVIPVGQASEAVAQPLAHKLRHAGYGIELGFSGNVGKRMKRANKLGARAAVLLGEDELAKQSATIRDLDTGEQELVSLDAVVEYLVRFR
ncbi:histidine--tRNA ligase [Denitrobaculum tricleocarpae]|uniref:Histidine--tRNA ligase n=1 Tax=Denitrobaculum tricleocarpae TaxID=2591009 RepID=A0A545T7M4_9PROT|nr:histidine--tRNA ligase [Denitrobaculum tricleocarpae]TQV73226.1 histidine--tRNA ligase [Denitrobaculum tricleocarpae]